MDIEVKPDSPLTPLFAQVRGNTQHILEGPGAFIPGAELHHAEDCPGCKLDAALSSIERHVQDAVALLDECLNDGDRAWEPEELVAQMEKVRAALPAREKEEETK